MTESKSPTEPTPQDELFALTEALCAGTLDAAGLGRLEALLKADPAAREFYGAYLDLHAGLRKWAPLDGPAAFASEVVAEISSENVAQPAAPVRPAEPAVDEARALFIRRRSRLAAVLLATAAALLLYLTLTAEPTAAPTGKVVLASASGARFFGEISPPLAGVLQPRRDYVLTHGLVEIAFPTGATAIVEAPAVFSVLSSSSLGLFVGNCSVHCPAGAEGFRVETQTAAVIDRGTRFSVKVAESGETDVHVVEGIADIQPKREGMTAPAAAGTAGLHRLHEREAGRVADDPTRPRPLEFTAAAYRAGLPDRVVSYVASTGAGGGAERLESVTVQRGGVPRTYPVGELIAVRPSGFASGPRRDPNGHLAEGAFPSGSPSETLTDHSLVTGLINPGGGPEITEDPVLNDPEDPAVPNTPGLAVRFVRPVANGPGPDVVLFELQSLANPADGDAFRVSPLRFAPGLRSHTVKGFDITMTSAEARRPVDFRLLRYPEPIRTLTDLLPEVPRRSVVGSRFRILAVGIDLADLGVAPGQSLDGLFIRDAADDDHRLDPTFIAGLPE